MARVTATFLSCVLLTAGSLQASSVEETYQAALTQEKGEGNIEEAIRLYKQVIAAHEKGEGDEKMAARAQLRIGVCQEKLGLAQARQTYEAVRDKYSDQPQVQVEAARRLGSTHRREAMIEEPSSLTASEFAIRLLQESERWPSLADSALINEQIRRIQDTVGRIDSVFINEQMYRHLEAVQLQMKQVERQMEQFQQHNMEQLQRQLKQAEQQTARHLETIHRNPLWYARIRPLSDQRYYHYANTPPVVPYAYEEVAEVPVQWKFRLDESKQPQRHRYATLDFDDSDWATINIGQAYEDQGYAGYDGWAWYRATFPVAADSVRSVLMAFGGLGAKDAFVYVNGHLVGQHYDQWDRPFILDISDHVVRDGENTVALYLYDDFGMGGVYGLINVHQPTDEVETDDFATNRGGRLEMVERNGWPVFKDHFTSGKRYSRYAHRPPRIPYTYKKVAEVPVQWKFLLSPYAEEDQEHQEVSLSRADFDDSHWADIDIGQAWEDQGYAGYDEGAWYRTRIEVNAEEGRPVHLAFGGVDNEAYVYVNGIFVGEHHGWNTPFILDISEAVNYKGQNVVAVRVYDGANMGGIYGTIEVIQPTGKENLDRYLANRGVLEKQKQTNRGGAEKRSFWSRFF